MALRARATKEGKAAGQPSLTPNQGRNQMLTPGTAVCWQAARKQTALRGRIVAVVEAGIAPAQAAPELIGLKTTQVKFNDLLKPRVHPHYLVMREEQTQRGAEHSCYYLPLACRVESVRGGSRATEEEAELAPERRKTKGAPA